MKTREDLLNTSRGYWEARALLTAVELGIFENIGRARRTAKTLAAKAGADPRATTMLLNALCGMGVLAKDKSSYRISKAMRPHLVEGEGSALPMLRHHARLWHRWHTLTDDVTAGDAKEPEGGFRGDAADAMAFTLAMRSGSKRFAPGVAEEVPLDSRELLLDLGGGPGTYAAAFARRNPRLRVVIVDLPHVCTAGAQLVAEEADVADRIAYHAADFDRDPLPDGADAVFLSHVIHSQTEAEVKSLFRKIRKALGPGGLLVVRDFFTSPDGTKPPSSSLFSLNMLVNATGGRSYSAEETARWLEAAGFDRVTARRSKAGSDASYLLARLTRAGR